MQDIKHITTDFAVSPQISAAHTGGTQGSGFHHSDLQPPRSRGCGQPTFAEIKAAAEAAGLEAHHIPIVPGQVTRG